MSIKDAKLLLIFFISFSLLSCENSAKRVVAHNSKAVLGSKRYPRDNKKYQQISENNLLAEYDDYSEYLKAQGEIIDETPLIKNIKTIQKNKRLDEFRDDRRSKGLFDGGLSNKTESSIPVDKRSDFTLANLFSNKSQKEKKPLKKEEKNDKNLYNILTKQDQKKIEVKNPQEENKKKESNSFSRFFSNLFKSNQSKKSITNENKIISKNLDNNKTLGSKSSVNLLPTKNNPQIKPSNIVVKEENEQLFNSDGSVIMK